MKISEMNTLQLSETLCRLAAPVGELMASPDVAKALEKLTSVKIENPIAYFGDFVSTVLPVALEKHQDATFAVIGALVGKTASQIKKQKAFETIKDIKNSFDKDLLDFFKLSGSLEQNELSE